MRCARGSVNTNKQTPIPARILWPALGFPAVIDPGNASTSDDATTCVTVVIVSKCKQINRKQASDHLRFVPWAQRHQRYLPPGTVNGFTEDELDVRSNPDYLEPGSPPGLIRYGKSDEFVQQIYFGYDAKVKNGFTAGLSWFVLKKYSDWGYSYVHEIRASRTASVRLAADQYNLFWINSNPDDTEKDISDELDLLIKQYATPGMQRAVDNMSNWLNDEQMADLNPFLQAYEYDYNALNLPYTQTKQLDPAHRTEVLHPLFVQAAMDHLKIGHITDLHVATRNDAYEENLRRGFFLPDAELEEPINPDTVKGEWIIVDFNNWNKSVTALYQKAKASCDVLLLTGDLIDYGRGHVGIQQGQELGADELYLVDRNWLLFYSLLASGDSYQKPAYTILGNHDWRLNPYPPLAPGAPDPRSMLNDYLRFKGRGKENVAQKDLDKKTREEMDRKLNEILKKAHGDGWQKAISYFYPATGKLNWYSENPDAAFQSLLQLWENAQTLNIEHLPTETKVESISWYLLLINPFLDYAFHMVGGYDILMLDWAQYEDLFFPIVENGKERPYHIWEAQHAADPGPMAKACLTDLQKDLVQNFVGRSGKAKVLGIHAPPIGAYTSWTDKLLGDGEAMFEFFRVTDAEPTADFTNLDYKNKKWRGPIYAIAPKDGPAGHAANYNSFVRNRDWLITTLGDEKANVRLVLAGHIHRNGVFVVDVPQNNPQNPAAASSRIRTYRVEPGVTQQAVPPAVTLAPHTHNAPLYVNTTSAGPRGHLFDVEGNTDCYIDSGYAVIDLSSDGIIQTLTFLNAKTANA